MINKQQQMDDAHIAITNWVNGFKEPVGLETLASGLAGHWHHEVSIYELHDLLDEMVKTGQIKDAGHWRYEI